MVMTQLQPHSIMAIIHSQQAWIILHVMLSPLVHMQHMPSLVISHLHMPFIMLIDIMIMPFIIMWQLTMLLPIIMQRFCIMLQAISSLHMQTIFMPSFIFSIFMVQHGIIIICMAGAAVMGMVMVPLPIVGMAIIPLSIIIDFIISPPHISLGPTIVVDWSYSLIVVLTVVARLIELWGAP